MAFCGAHRRLAFSKFEGLGNDFVIVDLRDLAQSWGSSLPSLVERAPEICDRRTGVGADGILVVAAAPDDRSRACMVVVNADGSRPEMCGNGLRCVAHYLCGGTPGAFFVHTDNGPLHCEVDLRTSGHAFVQIGMGAARVGEEHRPAAAPQRAFRHVNVGNPHAVHWVAPGEDPQALAQRLGPDIELDPAYPDRTNVEFVADRDGELVCWVWERGCGITQACGTGACATAAAAVHAGIRPVGQPISVRLPGGLLEIVVQDAQASAVQMTGPSRWVFDGSLPVSNAPQ